MGGSGWGGQGGCELKVLGKFKKKKFEGGGSGWGGGGSGWM